MSDYIALDLKFTTYDSTYANGVGIYVRTLRNFSEAIDYVGTAGENEGRGFGGRFADHKRKYANAESSYLIFDFTSGVNHSVATYLNLWQQIVTDGYQADRIYVPGVPATFPRVPSDSLRRSTEIWNLYVADLSDELPTLLRLFTTRRAALRAVEARLQTLLRSFYLETSGNPAFPLRVNIVGKAGDMKTRSLFLGDTRKIDLAHSDRVRINTMHLPFTSEFSTSFAAFVQTNATTTARSESNPLVLRTV